VDSRDVLFPRRWSSRRKADSSRRRFRSNAVDAAFDGDMPIPYPTDSLGVHGAFACLVQVRREQGPPSFLSRSAVAPKGLGQPAEEDPVLQRVRKLSVDEHAVLVDDGCLRPRILRRTEINSGTP
jgi:hypothetical protein